MKAIRRSVRPRAGAATTTSISTGLPRKLVAAVVAVAGSTLALATVAPGVASADVVTGQFVSKAGLHCGGQERVTGSQGFGPFELKQRSWIYYNCGNKTVRRKADVSNGFDGRCLGIGPGQARVLSAIWTPIVSVTGYRGSKAC